MHVSALGLAHAFFALHGKSGQRILEVGSAGESGTLREAMPRGAEWIGLDERPAPGVDVLGSGHAIPFEEGSFDIVASSSCLEHDPEFWTTFLEVARVLKPGGLFYLNVPAKGPYHAWPVDCWRFYPDAAQALARWATGQGRDVALVERFLAGTDADVWTDHVMIYGKAPRLADYPSLRETARHYRMDARNERRP